MATRAVGEGWLLLTKFIVRRFTNYGNMGDTDKHSKTNFLGCQDKQSGANPPCGVVETLQRKLLAGRSFVVRQVTK
ncbi:hypothetical protein A3863_07915 [Priestia endophytica]|nr:hypothetical protein A3863_07860 [Priestia endophytica]RAS90786.1 hypothetical protein A3863_07915 [Priestia endophytica]